MQGYNGKKYYGKYANGQRRVDEQAKKEKTCTAALTKEQKALQNAVKKACAALNQALDDYNAGKIDGDAYSEFSAAFKHARDAFQNSLH